MSVNASMGAQNSKIGTCPHGLPIGACPICNGMGGGASRRDVPRNPGEMTWNQCAAIGAMMKAQKAQRLAREADLQKSIQMAAKFEKIMESMSQKLANMTRILTAKTPAIIAKPASFLLNNIVGGVINFVKNMPATIGHSLNIISQKLTDITDKLAAVYGELKASTAKKISEFIGGIKKKLKSLFSIFSTSDSDNEDKKIEDDKRTFELKTFIHKLQERFSNKRDDIEKDEG